MIRKKTNLKLSFAFLEQSRQDSLSKADQLYEILTNLRFEGKVAYGRNIRQVKETVQYFRDKFMDYVQIDDTIIFPFLETHIPRLEPVIQLLCAEQKEFKESLASFETLLGRLLKEKDESRRGEQVEQLREKGIYMIFHLRSHLKAESESVNKVIERDLKGWEKEELLRLIQNRERGIHLK